MQNDDRTCLMQDADTEETLIEPKKKTYRVTVPSTSWLSYTIEAVSEEDAINRCWIDGEYVDVSDGSERWEDAEAEEEEDL